MTTLVAWRVKSMWMVLLHPGKLAMVNYLPGEGGLKMTRYWSLVNLRMVSYYKDC